MNQPSLLTEVDENRPQYLPKNTLVPNSGLSNGILEYQAIHSNARVERDEENAGYDVWNPHGETRIPASSMVKVDLGLCFNIPKDYILNFQTERSSIGRQSLVVLGGAIDWSYTGEVCIMLFNLTYHTIVIPQKNAIAQGILTYSPFLKLKEVSKITKVTNRGNKGFGSTNLNLR